MATPNDTPDTITIQLTRGQVTVIDAIDSDLCAFKWQASKCLTYASDNAYCARRTLAIKDSKPKTISIHRIILERIINRPLGRYDFCDHINGNPLDNRRSNLRLATPSQNAINRGKRSNNKSGYKGVAYRKDINQWAATICINRRNKHLGFFATPEDAYEAYCKAAIELHGDFANLG